MFGKCVLRQSTRGQRQLKPIISLNPWLFDESLVVRWKMGDRIGLWEEALEAGQRRNKSRRGAHLKNNSNERLSDLFL